MSDLRGLVRELERGADREKNIPVYGRALADTYLNYAATELTFSAFLLCEWMQDSEQPFVECQEIYGEIREFLMHVSEADSEQREALVGRAEKLRSRITSAMDVFTSYVDRLACYEQVLGRMVFRMEPDSELFDILEGISEEKFEDYVIQFLYADGDRMITFNRLRLLIQLIPVHMTKNKLLDRISDAVSLYEGGDRESLDSFVYMIRSAGTLHRPEDDTDVGQPVRDYLEKLEHTDFSGLDREAYDELREEMVAMTERVSVVTDFYCMVQRVVNAGYALCLAGEYVEKKSDDYTVCMEIVREAACGQCRDQSLVKVEGKIEKYVDKMSILEAILPEIQQSCQDIFREQGRQREFEHYGMISKLLSDSLFVRLCPEEDHDAVDHVVIREVTEELTAEFSQYLSGLPKAVRRSVMSAVLGELPITFANVDEIREYIRTNLFGCQDFSEKSRALIDIGELLREETSGLEWRGGNDLLV